MERGFIFLIGLFLRISLFNVSDVPFGGRLDAFFADLFWALLCLSCVTGLARGTHGWWPNQ